MTIPRNISVIAANQVIGVYQHALDGKSSMKDVSERAAVQLEQVLSEVFTKAYQYELAMAAKELDDQDVMAGHREVSHVDT